MDKIGECLVVCAGSTSLMCVCVFCFVVVVANSIPSQIGRLKFCVSLLSQEQILGLS